MSIVSTTVAANQGYRALADVVTAAEGINYRIIGGHMVQLLLHAYPAPQAQVRLTADADAGVDQQVAAAGDLHQALLTAGYKAVQGNSYQRQVDAEMLAVDLLTESEAGNEPIELGGRMFDAAPGLRLALAAEPLHLEVSVNLLGGDSLNFAARVPDVDEALVLKALAWDVRMADRDISDINTLLEIVAAHDGDLAERWLMKNPARARRGSRGDASRALYRIVGLNDRGQLRGVPNPARMAALIKRYVHNPASLDT
ncbi:hypothetical protein ACNHUS_06295 [Actinomycetes bacterium M1A6_2h]